MDKREHQRIEDAVDVIEEHPHLAIGGLIGHASNSPEGVYIGGVQLEERQHGIAIGLVLDEERASRLFAFLHDFSEGLVPTWEDHSFEQEILRHPEGAIAHDGEA